MAKVGPSGAVWPYLCGSTTGAVEAEVARARGKFPANTHLLAALTEEVGELAQALLQGQGKERVQAEAIQVACVALRIVEEGDADFGGWGTPLIGPGGEVPRG